MLYAKTLTFDARHLTLLPLNGPALSPSAWLRFDVIRHFLADKPAKSFLEIGCGMGALGARLARVYEYVGYEPDDASFAIAERRIPGRVLNEMLPQVATRTFDLVGAFEVLEHVEDDVGALQSWRNWLNPEGWLLLSVPAHPKRFGPTDRFAGHYRRYSRSMLADALTAAGYSRIEIVAIGWPLGYVLEAARNRLVPTDLPEDLSERTAGSGRFYQPSNGLGGWLTRLGTAPFRWLQRPTSHTDLGNAFVAFAQSPDTTGSD